PHHGGFGAVIDAGPDAAADRGGAQDGHQQSMAQEHPDAAAHPAFERPEAHPTAGRIRVAAAGTPRHPKPGSERLGWCSRWLVYSYTGPQALTLRRGLRFDG